MKVPCLRLLPQSAGRTSCTSRAGEPREDLPAPKIGDSYKPSDDWRKWYPEHWSSPVPGRDKIDADYTGDLKGLFVTDNAAKAIGVYSAASTIRSTRSISSRPLQEGAVTCIDCHSPARNEEGGEKGPKKTFAGCHDGFYTFEKYMPWDRQDRG